MSSHHKKRPGRYGEEEHQDESLSAPKVPEFKSGPNDMHGVTSASLGVQSSYDCDDDDGDDRKPPAREHFLLAARPRSEPDASGRPGVQNQLQLITGRPVYSSQRHEEISCNDSMACYAGDKSGSRAMMAFARDVETAVPKSGDASKEVSSKHSAANHRTLRSALSPGARWIRGMPSQERSNVGGHRSVASLEHSTVNCTVESGRNGHVSSHGNESESNESSNTSGTPHIVTATMVQEDTDDHNMASPPPMEAYIQEIPRALAVSETHLRRKRRVVAAILVLALATIIGLAVGLSMKGEAKTSEPDGSRPAPPLIPTLQKLRQEGVLRCGVSDRFGFSYVNVTTGIREGFEVDLCRAVAAAVFGEPDRVEIIRTTTGDKFPLLLDGTIDLQARTTTHTMERDVFEKTTGADYTFSIPYLYDGLRFGGVPFFVDCADEFSTTGECSGTAVCVNAGTTDLDILSNLLPRQSIVVLSTDTYGEALSSGMCNVVSGEQIKIAEITVRAQGYEGDYVVGSNVFSKEPLAMLTRGNDAQFSDFVNWVFRSLLVAEARGVTQNTAGMMEKTGAFGTEFESMFIDAVRSVGSYGEMYSRHLQEVVPRQGLNLINQGTGLIYSYPFGAVETVGPPPFTDGMLSAILARGRLTCGVAETSELFGLGLDYCKALSASIFGSDSSVEVVNLTDTKFQVLASGDIDVVANAPFSLASDVLEATTGQGFDFSQPYFYSSDGEALGIATREDDPQWSAFAYWIVMATFYAEEKSISKINSNEMPLVNLFGPDHGRMFRDAILAVGSYGEIYERSVQSSFPRNSRNLLNVNPVGPQFYVPPEWSL